MKKHICVLLTVSIVLFLVLLHTVYTAYEAGWVFKLGVTSFLMLGLVIVSCICVLWPYISQLVLTKDKKGSLHVP